MSKCAREKNDGGGVGDGCFFQWKFDCSKKNEKLTNCKQKRIESIINCSKVYNDMIHIDLQEALERHSNYSIQCHRGCVPTYTSTTQLDRHKKRAKQDLGEVPVKRARRSGSASFNFQLHCVFCGDECIVSKDPKNPTRWRPAYMDFPQCQS